MKKSNILQVQYFSIVLLVTALLFYSCTGGTNYVGGSGSSEGSSSSVSMGDAANWKYTSDNNFFVVGESVSELSISGDLGGKTLYYAAVNASTSDIDANSVKYIELSSADINSDVANVLEPVAFGDVSIAGAENHPHNLFEWEPDMSGVQISPLKAVDNRVSAKGTKVTQLTLTKDVTTKTVWTLVESDNYVQKTATLRAFNDACNVWVVDDYYTSGTAENGKINSTIAESLASVFSEIYSAERYVFGEESDKIYYSFEDGAFQTADMDYLSDTGTKVNLLVYDLYGDGSAGRALGFFNTADYYPNKADFEAMNPMVQGYSENWSNEGKFINLDSYWAVTDMSVLYTTIVHEFQHMINFSNKKMKGLEAESYFDEMCSMLSEDIMGQFLKDKGYGLEELNTVKCTRFKSFLPFYYRKGVTDWIETDRPLALQSYANIFAFGAYIVRKYGGAALVKEMMTNNKVNIDCIVAAVNTLSGNNFTFDDLFGQFIKACFNDSTYTFNKDAAQPLTYSGYSYPMSAINLWDASSIFNMESIILDGKIVKQALIDEVGEDKLDSVYKQSYLGPAVFANNVTMKLPANYGFLLKRALTFDADANHYDVHLKTTGSGTTSGMKVYLYIK